MTSSEIIRSALIKSGKSQAMLAEFMGCTRQNLNIRLRRETLTYNELEKALAFLGCRITVLDDDGQTLRHYGNSKGAKLTGQIGGKMFDTSKASLIESTSGTDAGSVAEFKELYVDATGQKFVAYRLPGGRGTISIDPAAIEGFKKTQCDTPTQR